MSQYKVQGWGGDSFTVSARDEDEAIVAAIIQYGDQVFRTEGTTRDGKEAVKTTIWVTKVDE